MTRITDMITEIQKHQHTKSEWKNALLRNNVYLLPECGTDAEKEYIAGYTQAKIGDLDGRKEAKLLRNRIVKELLSDGWETWTEPESHMGGSPYVEWRFSAARVKQ